jgi:predicted phosphoadenosine phosphosulfate sulfurtransferase
MARVKKFIDVDVLTAAKQRIRHIIETHDAIAVCFSGGKDSLAVLHIVREVLQEKCPEGTMPVVNCVFRDEELIPNVVIEFVNRYRKEPWINMLYFCVPLQSHKFILGRVIDYVQWDKNRPWLRPMPEHAIKTDEADTRVFDQYSMDAYVAEFFKGKLALITGIRAAESLIRFRASVNKLNDNYINATKSVRVTLCKPIYDWEENDVFRFFWERKIQYCPIYDWQMYANFALRVSTPLHAEYAKRIGKLREIDPAFYDGVLALFPEMLAQERYYKSLDRAGLNERYGQDFAGVKAYVTEHFADEQLANALDKLATIEGMAGKNPASYPPAYVLKYFITGSFKRMLLPIAKKAQ